MKRKRTTRNSLRCSYSSSSSQQQEQFCVYLPDECWELVFKNLPMDDQDYNSLSLVSKLFLSITNRLRSSLTIKYYETTQQVLNRFPNLTSLHLCGLSVDHLNKLLPQISTLKFNLTSLKLSNLHTMPINGLLDFSLNINKTLTSLTCSYTDYLLRTQMYLIAECFPNLQMLDFNRCDNFSPCAIPLVLLRCPKITHLNLAGCKTTIPRTMNIKAPNLEGLNLSYSTIDNESLIIISNTCRGILQLLLKYCDYVEHNGVNSVLQNCTQLREINLKHCPRLVDVNVDSMLLLRPSLTKITIPSGHCWVR